MINIRTLAITGLIAASVTACSVSSSSDAPPPPDGTVTFDWTLKGVHSTDECDAENVAKFDVIITTDDGAAVGEYSDHCDVFDTTISLPPGRYVANATLLDPNSAERTTEIPVQPFTIIGDTDLAIPLDFPPDSFKSSPQ